MKILDECLLHSEGKDRNAIDSSLQHSPHRKLHAFGVVNGGGKQDFVVVLNREILKCLNNLREKRVRDLRNDEPKYAAAPRT